jgi:deoxycytidine triphosphate deaminase
VKKIDGRKHLVRQTDLTRFAESDEEAERRFLEHKSVDPFPSIPPSLLNSADFSDYVRIAGLISPFFDDVEDIRPASYRVRVLGECAYWDEQGKKQTFLLQDGMEFLLPRNSIAYLTLEPTFRLPDYIKANYHLDVSHAFKGLLLNPGFIEAGYVGRLILPVHNPTANDYLLRARDSLIWVEFSKISPLPVWEQHDKHVVKFTRQGTFHGFPLRKQQKTLLDQLDDAVGRKGSVRSAVTGMFQTVRESVPASKKEPLPESRLHIFERLRDSVRLNPLKAAEWEAAVRDARR